MRFRFTTFFSLIISLFLFSQNESSVAVEYKTTGYATQSVLSSLEISDPLAPTVNAEMTVSESGALTYSVPVEVIKGINNFQPNVALVYNSQSGNGQAGWGWNIVGVSSITRGGKSKEIDGITIGPQFNDSDPFYLDGQRLIKIDNATFVTEKFSKIKINKLATRANA